MIVRENTMKDDKTCGLPLLIDPRQPDENNRAYAYRILRKNIMTIQLQPGCQLSEADLSERLVMSRTPIHEALMMLKSEWLVEVLPQRGSIVSKISIQYINEGYAMRQILEPALLRNLSGHLTREQLAELHDLLEKQDAAAVSGQDVPLTNKEFSLLCLLLEHSGAALTRDRIMDSVWGSGFDGENRTVDVHVRTLRTKLGAAGAYIETVRGVGYRFTPEKGSAP